MITTSRHVRTLGATHTQAGTRFRVWAPDALSVQLVIEGREEAMRRGRDGYWTAQAALAPGGLYQYRVDGKGPFPDPASRYQPRGVHGPSQVVDPDAFGWTDVDWTGIALEDAIFYELHVGTFTPEGTFAAAARKLRDLAELGVTAIELMPVSDFPGDRNWGYDGVAPFAPARCYGTPDELRAFVDRAHALKLAVYLDVVYNHFGPDGAYQGAFSKHYTSSVHSSPWGEGLNMDGTLSGPVRDYFAENAMHWIEEYHLDGLRLDATHAIVDDGPQHAVAHIAQAAHEALEGSNRRVYLIAEDHRNLASIVKSVAVGGWGLDGVWADDFHHQLRVALTGDHDGYFQDFEGSTASIAETARKGWFYSGQHASFFGGQRGSDPEGLAYKRFVFFLQNHDQIGNRAFGERLHHTIDLAAYRAVSALLLLLPETPLLFMGQEWAASTPFLYFTNHNAQLGRRVTEGRRREFSRFRAFADPEQWERIPDPQAQGSFEASKLRWDEREREPHASMLRFYRSLLALRRSGPAWTGGVSGQLEIEALSSDVLTFSRDGGLRVVIRLRGSGTTPIPSDSPWTTVWSSEDPAWTNDPNAVQVAVASVYFSRPGAVVLRDARISIGWENR